ncbi:MULTISPECIES: hypothetical protein [unclassified Kitasatospora]|uniref:hypothetical protein n=1 Tax=unclassified Kitasatospora TaxID=2633591 RepID=UPI000AFCBD2D|nr:MULTISPECIES: hypothetical protein [unclassified Kitasatospora]
MFEVLPGVGLALPHRAGVLRYGMSEAKAEWVVSTVADVRSGGWVCGVGWCFTAYYQGLNLRVSGDALSRQADEEDELGLFDIRIERLRETLAGPAAVPVVLDGVDVFGFPSREVAEAVSLNAYPDVRFGPLEAPYLAGFGMVRMR